MNHGTESFNVEKGDKIAKLILEKAAIFTPVEVNEIARTEGVDTEH